MNGLLLVAFMAVPLSGAPAYSREDAARAIADAAFASIHCGMPNAMPRVIERLRLTGHLLDPRSRADLDLVKAAARRLIERNDNLTFWCSGYREHFYRNFERPL